MRVILCSALLSLASCQCQPAVPGLLPGEELRYEVFPTTRELTAADVEELGAPDAQGTYRPAPTAVALAGLKRGDVLLGPPTVGNPNGVLVMVRASEAGAIATVRAPPQVAFRALHVKLNRTVGDFGAPANTWKDQTKQGLEARAKQTINYVLFDGDGDNGTTDDQLRLQAALGGGYSYFLGIDVDWDSVAEVPEAVIDCLLGDCSVKDLIPEIKAGFEVTSDAAADITVEGVAYKSFQKEQQLANIIVNPPVLVIGPLVFVIGVDVQAVLSGQASSRFKVRTRAAFEAKTSILYSSKTAGTFQKPTESHEFLLEESSVGLAAKVRASVQAELNVRLYGLLGPRAELGIFTELSAELAQGAACFRVNGGSTLGVGVVLGLEIPGYGPVDFAEVKEDFDLLNEELAKGECTVPPGGSGLAPGEGPDFQRFANPTFTPVSRAHEGLIRFHPAQAGSLSGLSLLRSIDGKVVVSGNNLESLTKLDETGAIVWAKTLVDDPYPGHNFTERTTMLPAAVAQGLNATLMVLTSPPGLISLKQDGATDWGKRLLWPRPGSFSALNGDSTEARQLSTLTADGAGGFFIAGTWVSPEAPTDKGPVRAVVMRVDGSGAVLWSKGVFGTGHNLFPVKVDVVGDAVSVVGVDREGSSFLRRVFQLRLSKEGALLGAQNLGCQEHVGENAQPTTTLVTQNGNLLVAGFQGPFYRGLLLSLKADGTPVFGASLYATTNLSYLRPSGLAELATSGLAMAGTYTNRFDNEEQFLALLDSAGKVQWFDGYTMRADPGEVSSSGRGAVLLTDDGGLFGVCTSRAPNPSSDGSLWASKVFAKNGEVSFIPGAAVRFPNRDHEDATCTPVATAFEVASEPLPFTVEPMKLEAFAPTGIKSRTLSP